MGDVVGAYARFFVEYVVHGCVVCLVNHFFELFCLKSLELCVCKSIESVNVKKIVFHGF